MDIDQNCRTFDVHVTVVVNILRNYNKQDAHYTILFIILNALHVSGGFSAHHQELKTFHTASGVCQACLLLPLAMAASKKDATFYNILYYSQCSTCFRWFLRPSSGAQNCTHSIGYMSSLLAATASVGELEVPSHQR